MTWDTAALRASHARFERELTAVVRKHVRAATRQARNDAATTTAFKSRTGKTKQSVKRAVALRSRGVRGTIKSGSKIARFMERGTRAHVISPKRARMLRFQIGGRTVFARSVRHPGTKPTWFMRDAAQRAHARMQLPLRQDLDRIGRMR